MEALGEIGDYMVKEYCGWVGTILRVNLTKEKIVKQPLDEELARKFIGGRGINAKILYDEVKPGIDPLGPENVLIFGTGPVTGALGPGTGRWTVTAKSPLTGIFGDANGGGYWAPELKYAGYDHIVFTGRAKSPVYLWIDDEHVELRDAKDLWGKDVFETDKILREEIGDREIRICSIGQAGENLVRFACVIADLYRAAARTGMGAVMGSKNLKAVAIRGTGGIRVAKPEEYVKYIEELFTSIYKNPGYPIISRLGTPSLVEGMRDRGNFPVRNYQYSMWPDDKIKFVLGETWYRDFSVKHKACFSCPIHCSHYYSVKTGPYAETFGGGIEYVHIGAMGIMTDTPDLGMLAKAHELASRYSMDECSLGSTIATAMEWYQRGIITKQDTDGIELTWGNKEAILETMENIVFRKGFGNILAEGAVRAAKKIGRGAIDYVMHSKGLTYGGALCGDNRVWVASMLSHCTSTRGGDHLRGSFCEEVDFLKPKDADETTLKEVEKRWGTTEAADPTSYHPVKADIIISIEHVCSATSMLGVCVFPSDWWLRILELKEYAKMFSLLTGFEMTKSELAEACERVYNVERAFSVREGITKMGDMPPKRFLEEPLPDGYWKGIKIDREKFEKLLQTYYEKRVWDINGIPTKKKLDELDLKYVADDLQKLGKYG